MWMALNTQFIDPGYSGEIAPITQNPCAAALHCRWENVIGEGSPTCVDSS